MWPTESFPRHVPGRAARLSASSHSSRYSVTGTSDRPGHGVPSAVRACGGGVYVYAAVAARQGLPFQRGHILQPPMNRRPIHAGHLTDRRARASAAAIIRRLRSVNVPGSAAALPPSAPPLVSDRASVAISLGRARKDACAAGNGHSLALVTTIADGALSACTVSQYHRNI